LDHREPTTL